MKPIDAAEWRGQLLADMSKRELIDVIAQLMKAQRAELEYVRQSRDKWMLTAFEQAA
jgi:hypothetical protein